MTEQRRLAAIVSADVAGYSRLMGRDESGTLAALKSLRQEVVDPAIARHGGRIVKTTGDGLLLEFASVVNAVRCAIEVQTVLADRTAGIAEDRRITFRIGINLGDIIVDGDDIFGDGVNVAARLQEIASPGGICISSRVHDDVRDRLDNAFDDGGTQTLKNIARPVQVWRWQPGTAAPPRLAPTPTALPLPDKPSIAVLPFQNMSGDPEQEYFADGIVEEIITALSRMRWLFVIARNSSFTYKGRAVGVKQVGSELGARYVLEGSVRKAANRVRITGQLIDSITGAHLWADRFEGTLNDLFELQDSVTESVVGAIAPSLERAEIERVKGKPTESLDAYDWYLRGIACVHQWTHDSHAQALRLFYRAVELDPEFASAYGMAARCYVWRQTYGWTTDSAQETAECVRLARRAVELGNNDAVALTAASFSLARVGRDLDAAAAVIDRALALNPNLATAWMTDGYVKVWLGEPDRAIESFSRAMRLSPLDPQLFNSQTGVALAHLIAGRHEDALPWIRKAHGEHSQFAPTIRYAAAINAFCGRQKEAQIAVSRMLESNPAMRVSMLSEPLRRPEHRARLEEGLRRAGLPD